MIRFKFPRRSIASVLSCLFFTVTFSIGVFAQTGTSTIRGTIADEQGKAVAGATVTLTNNEKSLTRTQTTNDSGTFTFTGIPPGVYNVEAESSGFKKAVLSDVRALVDAPADASLQLEIGNVNETVNVTSAGVDALVNTQDASLGNNFVSQQITQLPLESRNVVQLLSLQPGVTPDGYVAGGRSDQSNLTLDGIDVNEQQTGSDPDTGSPFTAVLRVTPDSIQEFRVTTTNSNAAQGRSSGAQVSLITKSGTNDFHGSLYEFHRNTVTTANTFFNNRAGTYEADDIPVLLGQNKVGDERVPRPKLLRNVFGGSIGGPIKKDRAFFFFTYEGRRDAAEQSVVRVVPTASLGAGALTFPGPDGNIVSIPAATVNSIYGRINGENPAALALFASAAARYPVNDNTLGDGYNTGGFRFNAKTPVNFNTNIVRLDYNLTKSGTQLLIFRGNFQADLTTFASQFPDTPSPRTWSHPYGFVAGHTWTINPTTINVFRYGLTREAFTSFGDSNVDEIDFRGVFIPYLYQRTLARVTPVHNLTDDFSHSFGNHNLQFGGNARFISNRRRSFSRAFDDASTNYFFYPSSSLVNPVLNAGYEFDPAFRTNLRIATSGVLGRFSQYTENFNFSRDLNLQPSGQSVDRTFVTQEYDSYVQDSWKVSPSLTLTYGLRYGISRPVYEANGYEAKPTISLGEFFSRRVAGMQSGMPYNDPITVDIAGIKNGKSSFYNTDRNNFQPRIAIAWSPNFKGGLLHKAFGGEGVSVLRGGFAITNDYFGQALAVNFEGNNNLGFSQARTISASTYNASSKPGPRFTGIGQQIRGLPNIGIITNLNFPSQVPSDGQRRIEGSLDDTLQSPINYSWNASYGRKLPGGFFVEASYIGRLARHLLAARDIATPNNLVDPKTKVDWYTAAGQLETYRVNQTPIENIPKIPYFENLYSGLNFGDLEFGDPTLTNTQAIYGLVAYESLGGFEIGNDWSTVQDILDADSGIPYFYQPQYGALSAYGTVGNSIYHGATLTVRQRFKEKLLFDFNYTLSKSIDIASGLQTSGVYGSAFILNPFRPNDNRAVSDFDLRHIINANALWQLPIGRNQPFFGNLPKVADAVLGGWQLTGIVRYNSGRPLTAPFDAGTWATNWEIQSNGVRIRPIQASPTRGDANNPPNIFSDVTAAYQSFRSARPGETGDRNIFRYPSYFALDMGLSKSFNMPWSENHKLQIRWETFNITNTQHLTGIDDFSLSLDPQFNTPQPTFGNFTDIQGSPRVMQFGFRYTF